VRGVELVDRDAGLSGQGFDSGGDDHLVAAAVKDVDRQPQLDDIIEHGLLLDAVLQRARERYPGLRMGADRLGQGQEPAEPGEVLRRGPRVCPQQTVESEQQPVTEAGGFVRDDIERGVNRRAEQQQTLDFTRISPRVVGSE